MLRRAVIAYIIVAAAFVAATVVFVVASIFAPAIRDAALIAFAVTLAVYFAMTSILAAMEARFTDRKLQIAGFYLFGGLTIPLFEFKRRGEEQVRHGTLAFALFAYVAIVFTHAAWSIIVAMTSLRMTPAYRVMGTLDTASTWIVWIVTAISVFRTAWPVGRKLLWIPFIIILPFFAAPLRYYSK